MICLKISVSGIWNFVQRHISAQCNGHRTPAVKPSTPMDTACWGCLPPPCSSFPGEGKLCLTSWYSHDLFWIRLFLVAGCLSSCPDSCLLWGGCLVVGQGLQTQGQGVLPAAVPQFMGQLVGGQSCSQLWSFALFSLLQKRMLFILQARCLLVCGAPFPTYPLFTSKGFSYCLVTCQPC